MLDAGREEHNVKIALPERKELFFGVYGKVLIATIEVPCDSNVCTLQKNIFEMLGYKEKIDFVPHGMTLYLARNKHGGWLKDEDVDPDYKIMEAWCPLFGDNGYFESDFKPGVPEIHILVKLPVELICSIVDVMGGSFRVLIKANKSVECLKDVIKAKNPAAIRCDIKDVWLFLAKKGDEWLSKDDPVVQKLREGKPHKDIQTIIAGQQMMESTIKDVLEKNNITGGRTLSPDQIHVLVKIPTEIRIKEMRVGTKLNSTTIKNGEKQSDVTVVTTVGESWTQLIAIIPMDVVHFHSFAWKVH